MNKPVVATIGGDASRRVDGDPLPCPGGRRVSACAPPAQGTRHQASASGARTSLSVALPHATSPRHSQHSVTARCRPRRGQGR